MADSLVSTFNCPNCGSPVTIRVAGQTLSVMCPACASAIGIENENYQILWKYEQVVDVKPLIPIGTRGKLHAADYEVIGFLLRSDEKGNYPWREYLLFNPYEGFRWLVEADGHWSFVTMIKSQSGFSMSKRYLYYQGEGYSRFLAGKARTNYILGEFYWKVEANDLVAVGDYVSPPHMLSYEFGDGEVVWSQALYTEPSVVRSAFNVTAPMPVRLGVGPHQPSPWISAWDGIKWKTGMAVALLVILHIFIYVTRDTTIFAQTFNYTKPATTPGAIEVESPSFEHKDLSAIEVEVQAPVNNSWLDADVDLVNTKTGATFPLSEEVSFYSGYDGDGYWSEGDQSQSAIIASVPPGAYMLRAELEADPKLASTAFNLIVHQGIPPIGNLAVAVLLILFAPAIIFWRKYSFESARWAESS